jgi:autotransporter-associated beta strand protein
MARFWHCAIALACLTAGAGTADAQLRIVQYNVNNADPDQTGPRTGMNTVLSAINASAKGGFARPIDLLVLEEANSVSTTGAAYASLLNTITGGTSYARSTVDGSTTGSGRPIAVYNSASLQLIGEARIGTTSGTAGHPRQTMRYQFRPVGYDSSADFYVYASHFKASTGGANEADRNNEARAIRTNADALGLGARIIYAGDFNFYTSSEAGFQTLTGTGHGQAFDPVNRVGSWNDSASFKDVHTQSPATTAVFNGQVTGGLDSRFDFQLVTGEVLDGRGFDYVSSSYWAFGNTATHALNGAITTGSAASLAAAIPGYTTSQASAVLTSLAQVTDHLPVVADYQLPAKMSAAFAGLPAQVIRGASVTGTLSVSNSAPVSVAAGADRLDYSYASSGLFTGSGTSSDLALGGANTHLLAASTATAGLRSGTVSVTASSPQAMSPTFSGTYSLGVLDHAIGSFAAATTTTSLDIDFGTLFENAAAETRSFSIFNRAGTLGSVWTAKLDLDAITPSGATGIFSTTLAPFTNLSSGSSRSFTATMAATTTGSFTTTLSLAASDENLLGAAGQTLLLTLRGVVQVADTIRTVTAGQVQVDSAAITGGGKLIKQGAGELIRGGSSSFTGGTVVQAGLLTVSSSAALGTGPLTVADNATLSLDTARLAATALDVATSGKLDLGTGRIEVAAGGITEAALRAGIVAGMDDGSWGGASGITSGSAAAAGGTRAVGYMIDAGGAATIAFAAPGDTNLDGLLDLDDIVAFVNAGLIDTGLAATWATGDFDYNGLVDLDDVIKFVGTDLYDKGSYLPAALGGLGVASPLNTGSPAEITSLGEASIVMVVPEPGGWGIVLQAAVAGAMALASRRRRA